MDTDKTSMAVNCANVAGVPHLTVLSKSRMAIRFQWSARMVSKVPIFSFHSSLNQDLENESGCRICRCRDPSDPGAVDTFTRPRLASRDCEWNNVKKKEGEMWQSGCYVCFCYSGGGGDVGTVMCSLVSIGFEFSVFGYTSFSVSVPIWHTVRNHVSSRATAALFVTKSTVLHWLATQMMDGLWSVPTWVLSWARCGYRGSIRMTQTTGVVAFVVVWVRIVFAI